MGYFSDLWWGFIGRRERFLATLDETAWLVLLQVAQVFEVLSSFAQVYSLLSFMSCASELLFRWIFNYLPLGCGNVLLEGGVEDRLSLFVSILLWLSSLQNLVNRWDEFRHSPVFRLQGLINLYLRKNYTVVEWYHGGLSLRLLTFLESLVPLGFLHRGWWIRLL